jgi:transposase
MSMLAELVDAVIGGDTHKDTHTLEMTTPTGAVIATTTIANTAAGYAEAISWITGHAPGDRLVVGLEGTRSYGCGLTRALTAAGLQVVEVEQPSRKARRSKGKSDPIDAHLASLAVLRMPEERKTLPRNDGPREALRILLVARNDLSTHRTAQINQLRALLLTGDDHDRELGTGTMTRTRLKLIAARTGTDDAGIEQQIRRAEARRLAISIDTATTELAANNKQLTTIVKMMAPTLLDKFGVGPSTAAQLLVSYSHPGRCRNEAAFAALAGVSPIPASSGKTVHYRLSRGGDRQLNRAIHTIMLSRRRSDSATLAYIAARADQNKSTRDIQRCLKRYIAREMFRELNAAAA